MACACAGTLVHALIATSNTFSSRDIRRHEVAALARRVLELGGRAHASLVHSPVKLSLEGGVLTDSCFGQK